MKKYFKLSSGNFLFILSLFLITSCGSLKKTQTKNETADQSKVIKDPKEGVDDEDESYTGGEIVVTNPATDDSSEKVVVLNPGEYRAGFFADSVTMEEVEEFSQKHLGEQIVDCYEVDEAQMLEMFDQQNNYLKSWTTEQKLSWVRDSIEVDDD